MSHAEYADWLLSVGIGWLGLAPTVVRASLISDILAGYEGKTEMLRSCFGGGKSKPEAAAIDDVEAFDNLFG